MMFPLTFPDPVHPMVGTDIVTSLLMLIVPALTAIHPCKRICCAPNAAATDRG